MVVLGYSKENEVVSTECLVLEYNHATCQTPRSITPTPEIRNTNLQKYAHKFDIMTKGKDFLVLTLVAR